MSSCQKRSRQMLMNCYAWHTLMHMRARGATIHIVVAARKIISCQRYGDGSCPWKNVTRSNLGIIQISLTHIFFPPISICLLPIHFHSSSREFRLRRYACCISLLLTFLRKLCKSEVLSLLKHGSKGVDPLRKFTHFHHS